jgi:hypothetical protein
MKQREIILKNLFSILCAIYILANQAAFASSTESVLLSNPLPAIANTYAAGDSTIVIYTLMNQSLRPLTFTLSGIYTPVSRVRVENDCFNIIPPFPLTCNIGIKIAPTTEDVGHTYNQTLIVDYYSPHVLTKDISFSVKAAIPGAAKITASPSSLTLAASGIPRTIAITATEGDALAVSYETSSPLPEGTTITPATCGDIAKDKSCIITIHPGPTPSAAAGSAPIPIGFKIQGINTNALDFDASVLTQGNIYQQGFIFSIDDTTPATGGIGGTIVSLTDNGSGIQWYNGNNIASGANSLTDGFTNTHAIITTQNTGDYAASLCANYEIDSGGHTPCQSEYSCYKKWYLPAICQIGPETNLSGCTPGTPNIVDNLVKKSIGGFSTSNSYWSSTEFPANATSFAWYQYVGNGNNSFQSAGNKYINFIAVRCVRAIN